MEPELQDSRLQIEIAEAQLQKTELEINSLRWQNSLLGRLNQFATVLTVLATIVTVFATLFGVWQGYQKFILDRQKENEVKLKELEERTDNQYRSELQQLLRYPFEEKQTIASAVFLFQDISDVIKKGYEINTSEFSENKQKMEEQRQELEKRGERVGFLLAQLIRSPEYDFTKDRNIEYDRKAMNYCEFYSTYLKLHPDENLDVLARYKSLLISLHDSDPKFYESVTRDSDTVFHGYKPASNENNFRRFLMLFHGYRKHIEILKGSFNEKAQDTKNNNSKLQEAFCWYLGSTRNEALTRDIFEFDENELRQRWEQCR